MTHVMAGGYCTLNAYSPLVCVKLGIRQLHPLLPLPLQPLQMAQRSVCAMRPRRLQTQLPWNPQHQLAFLWEAEVLGSQTDGCERIAE